MLSAFLGLTLGGAQATAAQRYASPAGVGPAATCPQGNPCSLQDAVGNAAVNDGDEVIVTPGTYTQTLELAVNDAITVHGTVGSPPTINTTAGIGLRVNDPGAVVSDLAINQTAGTNAIVVPYRNRRAHARSHDPGQRVRDHLQRRELTAQGQHLPEHQPLRRQRDRRVRGSRERDLHGAGSATSPPTRPDPSRPD